MKNATHFTQVNKILIAITLLVGTISSAQIKQTFTPRYNQTVKGNVTIIANNMLSRSATGNYTGSSDNHDFTDNVYVDIDNDNTTFNSSSANFVNPEPSLSCLAIKKAYLYWAAADKETSSGGENQPNWNYNDVKIMFPGQSTYTTLTANHAAGEVIYRGKDELNHFDNDPYICVKDITTQVTALSDPFGKYQVANVEAKIGSLTSHSGGNTGTSGGWQIVFVYESPNMPRKNITLFDGYAHVTSSTNNFNVDFNGFQTIPVGNVNADIVIGALEGDRSLSGDRLQIRNTSGTFVDISAPQRSSTNFFNSRITIGNSDFTNRVPASTNTLGFDAAVFNLSNPNNSIITNNQTSATFRMTSNQETYGLFLLGLAVDVYSPDFDPIQLQMTSGSNPVNPGDGIGFNFNVQNIGNDNAVNLAISTTLPPQVEFVSANGLPSGVTYTHNPTTGNLTFNFANGLADVGDPNLNINFQLEIKDQCYFLEDSCDLSFDLQFVATYNGIQNPSLQNTLSSSGVNECNLGNLLPVSININQPSAAIWATAPQGLDRTIQCNDTEALAEAQNLFPATDKCDFDLTKTSGDFVADGGCGNTGTYTNTWIFTDACGRTISEFVQVITVVSSGGLSFVEPLPQDATVECSDVPTAPTLTATNNCGTASVTYDENRTDGSCDSNYTLTRTWTASDECGNSIEHIQTITVQDTTAPVLETPASNITIECGSNGNGQTIEQWLESNGNASASDNCGPVTWTNDYDGTDSNCSHPIEVTFTATDLCGNSVFTKATYSIQDTVAPVIDGGQDMTVECNGLGNEQELQQWLESNAGATATDNCSSVTWSNDFSGLSDNCGATGSATVTFTATDGCGNSDSITFTFTVQDTTPPVFVGQLPQDMTVECDSLPDAPTLTANDNCGSVYMEYKEIIEETFCPATYTITRSWGATDNCGNFVIHSQTITVQDTTAPTFVEELPQDLTVECDDVPAAQTLTATDNCSNATVSFSETSNPGACAGNYTLIRTWTATDECDNQTVHEQTITVQGSTAPTFVEELPQDMTVECDSVPTAVILTATNNCGSAEVDFNETSTPGSCSGNYTITRTWTASDDCGNSVQHVQTITVQDTTAPVFVEELPQDLTVECDSVPTATTLTANDNCGTANVTYNENRADGSCDSNYTLTRTWTATDDCGNSVQHVQTITVQDTTAPTFVEELPQDLTVECDSVPTATTLTANDNCGTANVTYNENRADGSCDSNYTLTRTWTASDDCGNSVQHVQTITVQDTTAPVFVEELPQDLTVECDSVPTATTLTANDNCGTANVTYNENRADGSCDSNYTLTRTWTATDDCGNSVQHVQTITVQDTTAPTFVEELPQDLTVECDSVPTATTLTANDNCGTANVTYNENRTDGSCDSNYTLTRTWTASDECGNSVQHVQTITVQDTTAPVLETPASDITVECGNNGNGQTIEQWLESNGNASASDNCGPVTWTNDYNGASSNCSQPVEVTFTATDLCGNSVSATATYSVQDTVDPVIDGGLDMTIECSGQGYEQELQQWLQSNAGATATDNCSSVTWSNDFNGLSDGCGATGSATVTFTATDGCGNSDSITFTFTVQDTTAPTFVEELPQDLTVECDDVPAAQTLTATDNCSNATVSFSETSNPGACAGNYTLIRTWTATDECDNQTVHEQTITVQGSTAPTFVEELPQDLTVECDSVPTAVILTATNNCGSAEVDFNETSTPGSCYGNYTVTRTWTATDECGNQTTHIQTITVQDTTAPVFVEELPQDLTVECDSVPDMPTLTANDNCGSAYMEFKEVIVESSCPSSYTIVRSWAATDDCGNFVTHSQTITVQDTTPPVLETPASDITVECGNNGNGQTIEQWLESNGNASASDNCGPVTWTNDYNGASSNCSQPVEVTFTATDLCGNSVSTTATYSVQDTVDPIIDGGLDMTIECSGQGYEQELQQWLQSNAGATATDNCSSVTWSNDFNGLSDGCGATGSATVTFTATDGCGNSDSITFTFTVQDTTAPTFVEELPQDLTVECDSVPTATTLTANDNCGTANVTYNENRTDGSCDSNYTLTRTWTASDDCGNSVQHVQTITVQDTTAPTFVEELPQDLTVECDSVPAAATLTTQDSCGTASVDFQESTAQGSCPSAYTVTRTWTASDDCGNSVQHVQTITVQDTTAPTFVEELPQDLTVECDSVPAAATLTAQDSCGTASVDFQESTAQGSCPSAYTVTRTWTASDDCGNSVQHVQTITVQDTTAPTFVEELPQDLTVECDGVPAAATLTAQDSCGTASVDFQESTAQGSCPSAYTVTRTWTASDDCGNSVQHVQTITVQDTTAPTFVEELPQDLTVECDSVPAAATLTAQDSCGTASVDFQESTAQGSCPSAYTVTRTWTASDDCGNSVQHVQTITVQDTTAPTFVEELPQDLTVECDSVPAAATLTAQDSCGSANVDFNEEIISGACSGDYIITRDWIASDECGNTVQHTQIITVQDTTAPVIVGDFEEVINVNCSDIPEIPELVFEDACSDNMSVSNPEETIIGDINSNYQIIREWTVSDECGNQTTYTQTVNVSVQSSTLTFTADTLCTQDAPIDLFDVIGSDVDTSGTWEVISGNASLDDSIFDPSTVSTIGEYVFTYSVASADECPTNYEVSVMVNDDCVVLPCGEGDVIISTTVTPNGDTINEFFTISGIEECGFTIELQIFNRWGAKIYENNNYQNDWNGFASKASIGSSDKVPTGTYYYIINLKDSGLKPFAGPIYVATK